MKHTVKTVPPSFGYFPWGVKWRRRTSIQGCEIWSRCTQRKQNTEHPRTWMAFRHQNGEPTHVRPRTLKTAENKYLACAVNAPLSKLRRRQSDTAVKNANQQHQQQSTEGEKSPDVGAPARRWPAFNSSARSMCAKVICVDHENTK